MSEFVSQLTPTLFWDVARDQIDDINPTFHVRLTGELFSRRNAA